MTIEKIAKKNTVLIALLMFAFNFSNAHWSTKGPYGGAVSTFAAKGDTVFLASPTGGVYYATTTQYAAWKYINF